MRLRNADRAVVDIRKLRDYCLNPMHPDGRHKGRVFAAALGLTGDRAEDLRAAVLAAVRAREASAVKQDMHGQHYVVDFPMTTPVGRVLVRSSWIVRDGEDFPRLTSCYVLPRGARWRLPQ